ncbi:MAG: NUDIX hydrolase [Elusimicrobiales bacterium]|jgi:ADP-ribose pyrophosphatase
MKHKTLFEKRLKHRKVFSGNAVNFRVDDIRLPNGRTATREFLDHPGAVAVLPVLENGDIVLVRQYRYPVGEVTLEIPAGKLHSKKDPLIPRARAELREETGYTAAKLEKLSSFWPTSAFSNEILHIYLATGLKPGEMDPDEDEFLKVERMPFKKAAGLIKTGKIKDAKTIIALQAYLLREKFLSTYANRRTAYAF